MVLNKYLKASGKCFFIFLAALAGGFAGILPYFLPVSFSYQTIMIMEYILFPPFMIKIAFRQQKRSDFLKTTGLFWGVSFLLGGLLQFLYGRFAFVRDNGYPLLTLLAALLFACMFVQKGMEIIKENFLKKETYLKVVLRVGKKTIKTIGLMDTGNQLKEPISQKPVVIMEQELLKKQEISIPETNFYAIPYHSLGNKKGVMQGFIADEITIYEEQDARKIERVMIGISEEKLSMKGEYSLILNPML